jgi:hypothetical protein
MKQEHTRRIESFDEFWPFYVREHQKKLTRQLHFVGTSLAMSCVLGATLGKRRWMWLLAPVVGYGPAWIAHFFIEKNRPASFSYPFWSLQADLVMWGKMLAGTMDAEVERIVGGNGASRRAPEASAPDASPDPTMN